MPFSVSWHTLLDELAEHPEGATLITPLSHNRFRITDVQERRIIIQFDDTDEKQSLQRDQFETLYHRIQDADLYPTVMSVHPHFESVQRTSRRNRSLEDDDEGPSVLEDAGIDRERVTSVDRGKVDKALDVTTLSESDVYDIEEREYVQKDEGVEELREEVEELEQRIDDLTGFRTGSEMHG